MKKTIIVKNIAKSIRQFHESIVLKGTKGIIQKSAKISPKTLQKLKKKCIVNRMSCMYIERFFSVENLFEELRSNFRILLFFHVLNTILPANIFFTSERWKKEYTKPEYTKLKFYNITSFTLFRTVIKLHLKKRKKKEKENIVEISRIDLSLQSIVSYTIT